MTRMLVRSRLPRDVAGFQPQANSATGESISNVAGSSDVADATIGQKSRVRRCNSCDDHYCLGDSDSQFWVRQARVSAGHLPGCHRF